MSRKIFFLIFSFIIIILAKEFNCENFLEIKSLINNLNKDIIKNNNNNNGNPSYIKLYKGEKEILGELNQDIFGMSLHSSVNDLVFQEQLNITDPEGFPNAELNLTNFSIEGSQFALGNATEILYSDESSIIANDVLSNDNFLYMKLNFTYKDNEKKVESEEVYFTIGCSSMLYNKNYTINNSSKLNITGEVAFSWGHPNPNKSTNQTSPPLHSEFLCHSLNTYFLIRHKNNIYREQVFCKCFLKFCVFFKLLL